MKNTRDKIIYDRDYQLETDCVLAKMLEVGAPLDLSTYCAFAMIDPAELDAEVIADIPDVILANSRWVQ